MKPKDSGFTFVEILVSINIGSIMILIALFFYLFLFKFSISFGKNFNEEVKVLGFISQTEKKLERLEKFEIKVSQSLISIPISDIDTITFSDTSFANIDGYSIEDINNVMYEVNLLEGDVIVGKLHTQKFQSMDSQNINSVIINSVIIKSIYISFNKQNKKYLLKHTIPLLPTRRFINITKND